MTTTSRRRSVKETPTEQDAPSESSVNVVSSSEAQPASVVTMSAPLLAEPKELVVAQSPIVQSMPTPSSAPLTSVPAPQQYHQYAPQQSFQQQNRPPQRMQRDMRFRPGQQSPVRAIPTMVVDPNPNYVAKYEIVMPKEDNMLEYSYNAGYTESKTARKALLKQLKDATEEGARSRCWSCNTLRVMHFIWHSDVTNFDDVGLAFCEKCGSWSVM